MTRVMQDSAVEHARSLGMSDEPIVRAMICACLKHPLHCTAILRRACLGCSWASSVVSECFDSAMLPPAPCGAATLTCFPQTLYPACGVASRFILKPAFSTCFASAAKWAWAISLKSQRP